MSISGELIKSGAADLGDITNIMTASSITELKRYIDKSIAAKKKENDMIGQLQQQLQQYDQEMKNLQKQLQQSEQRNQQLQNQIQSNNQTKLQLEAEKVEIEKEKVRNDKDHNEKLIEVKKQQVQAQVAEIFDGNPYNNKIKSVV